MLYYDISDILDYARNNSTVSGIQRVGLTILSRLATTHGEQAVRLIAYRGGSQPIFSYSTAPFRGIYQYDQDVLCNQFQLRSTLSERISDFFLADWVNYARRKWSRTELSWRRDTRPCNRDILDRTAAISNAGIGRNIQLVNDDVVYLGGANWGNHDYLQRLAWQRRRRNIKIVQFIHDLIPIRLPEYVVNGVPTQFTAWLDFLSENVDLFIANSEATRADLVDWLGRRGRRVDNTVVKLAHQFGTHARSTGPILSEATSKDVVSSLLPEIAGRPYVLSVGTFEPRKNGLALLKVWQRILARLNEDTPQLVLAGNKGWKRRDFDEFLSQTDQLGGYVSILECPSDLDLATLYRSCLFTAYVSHMEGWGLPIGESLWFGRPVVCSRAGAMPEVGGALVEYVDPASLDSIEAGVMRLISDADYREDRVSLIRRASLRSWQDVADDLWAELAAVTGRGLVSSSQ